MDTTGFLRCPYCRKKKDLRLTTPFVGQFLENFVVDDQLLEQVMRCNIKEHRAKLVNPRKAILPGCWVTMEC